MVMNYKTIGRLGPEEIHEGTIFYHCYAGEAIKHLALDEPQEIKPNKWVWKARNIQYDDIPEKNQEIITFTFYTEHPDRSPYIFDYPAELKMVDIESYL